eukprot:3587394-Rhodomonas_salina.1
MLVQPRRSFAGSLMSLPVFFGPSGTTFSPPARASVPLSTDMSNLVESFEQNSISWEIVVYRWNEETSQWVLFDSSNPFIEKAAIWFNTPSFSSYAAVVQNIPGVPIVTPRPPEVDGGGGIIATPAPLNLPPAPKPLDFDITESDDTSILFGPLLIAIPIVLCALCSLGMLCYFSRLRFGSQRAPGK